MFWSRKPKPVPEPIPVRIVVCKACKGWEMSPYWVDGSLEFCVPCRRHILRLELLSEAARREAYFKENPPC